MKRVWLSALVLLGLLAGCSSTSGPVQETPSTSATSSTVAAPFHATVDLSNFDATCHEVACWLPTQWAPKLVPGETVSLRNQWPMDGTVVLVVCQTNGETYRDQYGNPTDAWYGILVPADKLEPLKPGVGPQSLPKDGGYIGYVGAAWIRGGSGKQAPAC